MGDGDNPSFRPSMPRKLNPATNHISLSHDVAGFGLQALTGSRRIIRRLYGGPFVLLNKIPVN